MAFEHQGQPPTQDPSETPTWTYPTRFCRICREDVVPTVTMYPPGVPPRFQTPIVEYKNEDEYGRLVKPCKCTGSMRYIHELCLLRSRTENNRKGSMWKCHTCGHKFNFQRLAAQRFLSSRHSAAILTVVAIAMFIFLLGFIADPIINLYVDPYETLLGEQSVWDEVKMKSSGTSLISAWTQHFTKGLVSMGLIGFVKAMVLNPLNWLNIRHHLGMTSARTTATGRDRTISINWLAVLFGIISAFYFFSQWVQTVSQITLRRIGNNIVDTKLPGDDDDLKPPAGWRSQYESTSQPASGSTQDHVDTPDAMFAKASESMFRKEESNSRLNSSPEDKGGDSQTATSVGSLESSPVLVESWPDGEDDVGRSSALDGIHNQSWSFASIN